MSYSSFSVHLDRTARHPQIARSVSPGAIQISDPDMTVAIYFGSAPSDIIAIADGLIEVLQDLRSDALLYLAKEPEQTDPITAAKAEADR